MFGRKICSNCSEKVNKKNNFCSNCGKKFTGDKNKEDYGMLGKNDHISENDIAMNPFNNMGITGSMLNKALNHAMKMLEKEMGNFNPEVSTKKMPRGGFQLFINGKKIEIPFENMPQPKMKKSKTEKILLANLPQGILKDFAKLEKREPKTNVRRFSSRVIYELEIPGIVSDKDISIMPLEETLEVKAIANKIAYFKSLPNFPITNYEISDDKLVLEMFVGD